MMNNGVLAGFPVRFCGRFRCCTPRPDSHTPGPKLPHTRIKETRSAKHTRPVPGLVHLSRLAQQTRVPRILRISTHVLTS
jgi:hypothetical protein